MPGRSYEKLDIETFGRHLIETGDLDPVYYIVDAPLTDAHRRRWLVAYWCLYHCGSASYISEGEGSEFWKRLMTAATQEHPTPLGERWPRGHERRHFRGRQGYAAVDELSRAYPIPEMMVTNLVNLCAGEHFVKVAEQVQKHRGFGPWMSFKVADMLERVEGVAVDFDQAAVFMFKDPVEAAKMLWRHHAQLPPTAQPKDLRQMLDAVVTHLSGRFGGLLAPPKRDREVGVQEIETVLCKWKSHLHGRYPLWNDTDEIRHGLEKWASVSETAGLLLRHLPSRQENT